MRTTSSVSSGASFSSSSLPSLSVVLCVHNQASLIAERVREISENLACCTEAFEIVVVDRGSVDDPRGALRNFQAPQVRIIGVTADCGDTLALVAGLRCARFPIALTLRASGEDDPKQIRKILAPFLYGARVVCSNRINLFAEGWFRALLSVFRGSMVRLFSASADGDPESKFKAFFVSDGLRYLKHEGALRWLAYKIARAGGRCENVNVHSRSHSKLGNRFGLSQPAQKVSLERTGSKVA